LEVFERRPCPGATAIVGEGPPSENLHNFGKEDAPEPVVMNVSHETLAEMIGTTRSRVSFFMNKFRKLGLIDYNGTLRVHSSLLGVVLHDGPHAVHSSKAANLDQDFE
jgi:CRP/FNR family cyclic AMP-dependent transcriptional regulator